MEIVKNLGLLFQRMCNVTNQSSEQTGDASNQSSPSILVVVGKILEVKVEVIEEENKKQCKYNAKIKNINEVRFDISENLSGKKYYYQFEKISDEYEPRRTKIEVINVATDDESIFDVLKLAFEKDYIAEVGFYFKSDKDSNSNSNKSKNNKPYIILYVNIRKPQEEI